MYCECGNISENRETGLCASCGAAARKAERQALKVKEVKPIRKVSGKRAKETREYQKLAQLYLNTHKVCEVMECNNRSNQIHHVGGRENGRLLDTFYFLAVCPDCHRKITDDSKWAILNGYSILRTTI